MMKRGRIESLPVEEEDLAGVSDVFRDVEYDGRYGLGAGFWKPGEKIWVLQTLEGYHLRGFLEADSFIIHEQYENEIRERELAREREFLRDLKTTLDATARARRARQTQRAEQRTQLRAQLRARQIARTAARRRGDLINDSVDSAVSSVVSSAVSSVVSADMAHGTHAIRDVDDESDAHGANDAADAADDTYDPAHDVIDVTYPSTYRGLPAPNDPAVIWVAGNEEIPHTSPRAWKNTGRVYTRAKCGQLQLRGNVRGKACHLPAGNGTSHLGAGRCYAHGGARRVGRAAGAWLMAHAFAQQLNVSPWEALLMAVRIAAGKVAYIESVLASANSDLELEGRRPVEMGDDGVISSGATRVGGGGVGNRKRSGGDDADGADGTDNATEKTWLGGAGIVLLHPDTGEPLGAGRYRDLSWWVEKGEIWHDRLVKSSKMAIDAGIARWQVERVEAEAHTIAQVLNGILDELGDDITEDQALRLRARMRKELLRIEEQANSTNNVNSGVGSSFTPHELSS